MSTKEFSVVARYIKETDPSQFKNICSIINSKSLIQIGMFVEMTDPEMFESIVEGK